MRRLGTVLYTGCISETSRISCLRMHTSADIKDKKNCAEFRSSFFFHLHPAPRLKQRGGIQGTVVHPRADSGFPGSDALAVARAKRPAGRPRTRHGHGEAPGDVQSACGGEPTVSRGEREVCERGCQWKGFLRKKKVQGSECHVWRVTDSWHPRNAPEDRPLVHRESGTDVIGGKGRGGGGGDPWVTCRERRMHCLQSGLLSQHNGCNSASDPGPAGCTQM